MAAGIKDVERVERINARLVPDAHEVLTPGEAMAGMLLNGLGFATRPLSGTPQFFANTPLARLCREGLRAERWNRCKLGRTRDEAYPDGCDLVFHEVALVLCAQEGMDLRFNQLDTPSVTLPGAYVPDSAEQAMTITSGASKDPRPDLKQVVLELLVSQEGGGPFGRKSWDGHTSAIKVFQERAPALLAAFQHAPSPRSLSADAKLSPEDKTSNLQPLSVITRIPHPLSSVSQVITPALAWDTWPRFDAATRSPCLELCHDGMAQRWLIVQSNAALERAEATLAQARQREEVAITKPRLPRQATRFQPAEVAQDALAALAQRWTYHQVDASTLIAHKRDGGQGRPTPPPPAGHRRAKPGPSPT